MRPEKALHKKAAISGDGTRQTPSEMVAALNSFPRAFSSKMQYKGLLKQQNLIQLVLFMKVSSTYRYVHAFHVPSHSQLSTQFDFRARHRKMRSCHCCQLKTSTPTPRMFRVSDIPTEALLCGDTLVTRAQAS